MTGAANCEHFREPVLRRVRLRMLWTNGNNYTYFVLFKLLYYEKHDVSAKKKEKDVYI